MEESNSKDGFKIFDLIGNNSLDWHPKSSKAVNKSKSSRSSERPAPVSKLVPEGGPYSLDSKFDCCAFMIHCPKHDSIAVAKPHNVQAVWLPFTPLPPNKSWQDGALSGSFIVLSAGDTNICLALKSNPPYLDIQCMHVLRLQLPQTLRFITRLIYYIKLDPSTRNKQFKCCQNTFRLEWMPISNVVKGKIKYAWGPELTEYCRLISTSISQHVTEYSLEQAFTYIPRDPPRNMEEAILRSIKITEKDIERLYADYLDHCFPSFYQSFDSFRYYMEKYGFELNESRLGMLFKAFNYHNNGYLSFHEFLIGLALMEPNSQHGEFRAKFIFRFYDTESNGHLSKDEFLQIVADIYPNDNKETIYKKANDILHDIKTKTIKNKEVICLEDFIFAIGTHKFRGTSVLCRASKPIFPQISRSIAARTLKTSAKTSLSAIVFNRSYKGTCMSCKSKRYELATHSLQINGAGLVTKSHQLLDLIDGDKLLQKRSIEYVFDKKSAANLVIEMVRNFNLHKGTNRNPNGLLASHPEQLYKIIQELYHEMIIILDGELKCKKVSSPCFVIGDIHGNLEDLLSLEKAIWRRVPCVGANYLFLGDYVDRGRWSLECALYLIAFKILTPHNVTMLRGNHEVRDLQIHYTYKNECLQKYGDNYGEKIWQITNSLFDRFPVCAVIDDSIYCAHGGIPRSASSLDELYSIQKNIPDPQKDSTVAWEILWSDPCHMQQFNDWVEIISNSNEDIEQGYIRNNKRGTAFFFNELAAKNFLSKNGLSHIIRAHEVPQPGFTFHFGNKCATIFSCSHYCGNNNDSACILVDNQTLRVVHLDTVNNLPATD